MICLFLSFRHYSISLIWPLTSMYKMQTDGLHSCMLPKLAPPLSLNTFSRKGRIPTSAKPVDSLLCICLHKRRMWWRVDCYWREGLTRSWLGGRKNWPPYTSQLTGMQSIIIVYDLIMCVEIVQVQNSLNRASLNGHNFSSVGPMKLISGFSESLERDLSNGMFKSKIR